MGWLWLYCVFGGRREYILETQDERACRLANEAKAWAAIVDFFRHPVVRYSLLIFFGYWMLGGIGWVLQDFGACDVDPHNPAIVSFATALCR